MTITVIINYSDIILEIDVYIKPLLIQVIYMSLKPALSNKESLNEATSI